MSVGSAVIRAFVLLAALALTPACSLLPVTQIPPDAMTETAMTETFVRIHMYMKEHRKVPPSLAVLPKRTGYMNRTTDGWGRELRYTVDDRGVIALTSLGADGKPGGEGLNSDIVRRYRTRNPDGSLNIDDELWIVHAEIR
jgi:hypothetical protein